MRKIASRKYRWDLEALRSGKNRLIEEKNNLEENKGVVENLRAEIEENWQSVSSEIYLEELEVDIKDLNFIIKAADELGTLLEKVISQEYGECESKITSKLNSLASSISEVTGMDLNKIYVQHSSLSGIAQSLQTVVSNIKSMESAMDYLTDQSNTMWEGKAKEEAVKDFEKLKKRTQTVCEELQKRADSIKEAAAVYEKRETKNVSDVSSLSTENIFG